MADAFAGREGDAEYLECVVELQDECLYGVGGCAADWYVTCQDRGGGRGVRRFGGVRRCLPS